MNSVWGVGSLAEKPNCRNKMERKLQLLQRALKMPEGEFLKEHRRQEGYRERGTP